MTYGPRVTCTPTDHDEWTQLRDDHGRPFALACPRCMATVPVPEVEPGVRLVALPPGWEDDEKANPTIGEYWRR